MALRILHLEDSPEDAFLIKRALSEQISVEMLLARTRAEFVSALESKSADLILADSGVPGFSGLEALKIAHEHHPEVPFICLSGSDDRRQVELLLDAGAQDYIQKDQVRRLVNTVRLVGENARLTRVTHGMSRLIATVQELSLARDLESVMAVVRHAARELTGADGATFVLRDDDKCFYADEDAISPLWKGQRFPMAQCISGWVMLNRQSVVIEDIYKDTRIPADAYRPTFVKSLAMVPIRAHEPIGAIGIYWAEKRRPTENELELLQALANTTSVAMENVRVYGELEQRVQTRTAQLAAANEELESFAYAVSHDLGAPLRCIRGYCELLMKESGKDLNPTGTLYLTKALEGTKQMRELMEDLLRLSRVTQAEMRITDVKLSALAEQLLREVMASAPERKAEVIIAPDLQVRGDLGLLRIALENLLSNAWKFTSHEPVAKIEFGARVLESGACEYFVRDNGAGFEMEYADKLFRPFRRLHTQDEFPGSGIGLCTVKRVVQRHGGLIRAEGKPGEGAAFYFTLR